MDETGEGDEEVQATSYKVSHKDVIYSIGNIVNNIVIIFVVPNL